MVIKLLPSPISSQPWQMEGGGLLQTSDLERMEIEGVHPQISVATLMITWLPEHETFLIFLEFPLEFEFKLIIVMIKKKKKVPFLGVTYSSLQPSHQRRWRQHEDRLPGDVEV